MKSVEELLEEDHKDLEDTAAAFLVAYGAGGREDSTMLSPSEFSEVSTPSSVGTPANEGRQRQVCRPRRAASGNGHYHNEAHVQITIRHLVRFYPRSPHIGLGLWVFTHNFPRTLIFTETLKGRMPD